MLALGSPTDSGLAFESNNGHTQQESDSRHAVGVSVKVLSGGGGLRRQSGDTIRRPSQTPSGVGGLVDNNNPVTSLKTLRKGAGGAFPAGFTCYTLSALSRRRSYPRQALPRGDPSPPVVSSSTPRPILAGSTERRSPKRPERRTARSSGARGLWCFYFGAIIPKNQAPACKPKKEIHDPR